MNYAALLDVLKFLPGDLSSNVNLTALASIVVPDLLTGKGIDAEIADVVAHADAIFPSPLTRPLAVFLLQSIARLHKPAA